MAIFPGEPGLASRPFNMGVFTAYIMLLIVVSYRRCGRNLRAKLYTVLNSLSANHAYLKMLYSPLPFTYSSTAHPFGTSLDGLWLQYEKKPMTD